MARFFATEPTGGNKMSKSRSIIIALAICVILETIPVVLGQSNVGPYFSFESHNYPGEFIRHANYLGERTPISSRFDQMDSTFALRPGLDGTRDGVPEIANASVPGQAAAWWPGDGHANDMIGGNNGTLINGASFAQGLVGQAFSFNGVNQYVQAPNPVNFGSQDFTIDLLVNFNSVPPPSPIDNPSNIFIGDDDGAGNLNKWFFALGGGVLNFHIKNPRIASQFFAQAPFQPNPHQWYNLAVTRSSGTISIYVNGQKVSSEFTSAVSSPSSPLTIGWANDNVGYFNGLIDEVRIYNRALSDSELQSIANAAVPENANAAVLDLTGVWNCDDGGTYYLNFLL